MQRRGTLLSLWGKKENWESFLEELILKLGHEISLGFYFLIYKTGGLGKIHYLCLELKNTQ